MKKKLTAIFLVLTLFGSNVALGDDVQSQESQEHQVQTQSEQTLTLTEEEVKKLTTKHYDDILKIIKKEKPYLKKREIDDAILGMLAIDNMDDAIRLTLRNEKIVVVPLGDDDFVVWDTEYAWAHKRIQYAREYHKDGSLFGIIKIRRISKNKYAFYYYRLPENALDYTHWHLKHVLIYYKSKNPVSFITTADGKIRSITYQDKVFLTDLPNVVNIDNTDLKYIGTLSGDIARNIGFWLGTTLAFPFAPFIMLILFMTNPT